jgi:hypothetical protein
MIAHAPVLDRHAELIAPATSASGGSALSSTDWFTMAILRSASTVPSTEWLISEIEQLLPVTGVGKVAAEHEIAVDIRTASAATRFVYLLPRSTPIPEVTADLDGDISFDWFGPAGKMFSVSINRDGRIAYAGRFGDTSKVHGIEKLSQICPPEILRGISKATS